MPMYRVILSILAIVHVTLGTLDTSVDTELSSCINNICDWQSISRVKMHQDNLRQVADELASTGKGILAADESTGTIGKRFLKNGVENSEVYALFNVRTSSNTTPPMCNSASENSQGGQ